MFEKLAMKYIILKVKMYNRLGEYSPGNYWYRKYRVLRNHSGPAAMAFVKVMDDINFKVTLQKRNMKSSGNHEW